MVSTSTFQIDRCRADIHMYNTGQLQQPLQCDLCYVSQCCVTTAPPPATRLQTSSCKSAYLHSLASIPPPTHYTPLYYIDTCHVASIPPPTHHTWTLLHYIDTCHVASLPLPTQHTWTLLTSLYIVLHRLLHKSRGLDTTSNTKHQTRGRACPQYIINTA